MKFYPAFILLAVFALSACSTTTDFNGVYPGAKPMDPLQMPPDLSQPDSGDSSNPITSFSGYQQSLNADSNGDALQFTQGMRFVRDGSLFWVEVKDSPDNVWHSLRQFFKQLGFKIVLSQPSLGLMQTNWQENRKGLPSANNWFTKMIGKLYDSGVMDSYRAHLEYDDQNKITRVFISLQGVREINGDDSKKIRDSGAEWIGRPANPALEEEMLMRFMAFRGLGVKQAKQAVAQVKDVIKATLKQTADGEELQYDDGFARVWRLTGIALDRVGVTVDDRNRSAGVYYIQLPDSFKLAGKGGFFTSARKPSQAKYLLVVKEENDHTLIRVKPRGEAGKDFKEVARLLLEEIKNNLQ